MERYPSWAVFKVHEGTLDVAVAGNVLAFWSASVAENAALTMTEVGIESVVVGYQCAVCGERFTGSASEEQVEAVTRTGKHVAAHFDCADSEEWELA